MVVAGGISGAEVMVRQSDFPSDLKTLKQNMVAVIAALILLVQTHTKLYLSFLQIPVLLNSKS
jgi:hypothetical protein